MTATNVSAKTKPQPETGPTPRCQGAEFLQATADQLGDALAVFDDRDRLVASNAALARFFGIPRAALRDGSLGSIARSFRACFRTSAEAEAAEHFLRAEIVGPRTREWRVEHPVARVLEVTVHPVRGAIGGKSGRACVWKDITEKRRLQQALQDAEKSDSIGKLANGIAHDFNNILTAISGNLSLALEQLASGQSGSSILSHLGDAGKAATAGRDLVKKLMSFARRSDHAVESFDLGLLVNEVRSLLKHSISPLILVEFSLPKNLWSVHADRSGIQQVIMNLCVNAVDAMKAQGSGTLTISAKNMFPVQANDTFSGKADTDYVLLEVRDSGPGIPEHVLPHIFKPLFTTKPAGEGTGLGLANCREIVEAHEGWIEAISRPGHGAVFRVGLPQGTAVAPRAPDAPAASVSRPRCHESVLVVDDDLLVRTVNAQLLRAAGFTVFTANDGIEALDWLKGRGNKADAVLLDITMPRLSGTDAMREIRRLHPGLPVVLCSGSPSMSSDEALKTARCGQPDATLSKPYDVAELTRTLRSTLDKAAQSADGKS